MRVVMIWRDSQDYSRTVIDWLHDFERRTGKLPESFSPDEGEGQNLARVYDVVEYPTILALDDSGKVLQEWRGEMMPQVNEVSYYMLDN